MYLVDTVEENLVEFLVKNGYDVWLLDWRASIDLHITEEYNADTVAQYDYPGAVSFILNLLESEKSPYTSLHVVVHCVGSITFFMSMLHGFVKKQQIRSIFASQVAVHLIPAARSKAFSAFHAPNLLEYLFKEFDPVPTGRVSDVVLQILSTFTTPYSCDQPNRAVCDRISALYGLIYEHTNLNSETHGILQELFGMAKTLVFAHLASMMRAGHLVDVHGRESYVLPNNMDNLNLPITFISGEKNQCFLPESTKQTFDLLRTTFPSQQYNREVIKGYGHIDCIFGSSANKDVYPSILNHLNKFKMF